MAKRKVFHIHSDVKFIDDTIRFEGDVFDNTVVIIGKKSTYKGYYSENASYCESSPQALQNLVTICSQADLVVLYSLNTDKCFLANRLPDTVKIAWRFFGYELYSKRPSSVLSKSTNKYKKRYNIGMFSFLKIYLSKIKHFDKYIESRRAVNRIDCFLGLSDYEYDVLKLNWPNLPNFVQLPFLDREVNFIYEQKRNVIVIGNNRNRYNNHLDVLGIISDSKNQLNYTYIIFFSYGSYNIYTDAVRKAANKIKSVKFIERFLAKDDFTEVYTHASAFVMNGYRQMAMGNIFTAICNGLKVYLNEKNIIYHWLKKEGYNIYSIKDFASDIENDNIKFTSEEMKYNIAQYHQMVKKYTVEDFQSKMHSLISKKPESNIMNITLPNNIHNKVIYSFCCLLSVYLC
ncbi:MAG: hypothetical protein WD491_05335 [Balneolales bacterium]